VHACVALLSTVRDIGGRSELFQAGTNAGMTELSHWATKDRISLFTYGERLCEVREVWHDTMQEKTCNWR